MKITIINYESGNVASVINAFNYVAKNYQIKISSDILDIKSADFLVLPGVGAFGDCINSLQKIDNLIDELKYQITIKKKPFLGLCVGMQVLASKGLENGEFEGLDLISGIVKPITQKNIEQNKIQQNNFKIPHMGWNNIIIKKPSKTLRDIKNNDHFYFANSYYFCPDDESSIVAEIDYSIKIPAIIEKDNITAIQFHPEKSCESGLKILSNFLSR